MKRYLKFTVLTFASIVLVSFSTLYLFDLYTDVSVRKFGSNTAKSLSWGWEAYNDSDVKSQPTNLSLGFLLIENLMIQFSERQIGYDEYKSGWRTAIAENPQLAYLALNRYGKAYFEGFNDTMLAVHKAALEKYAGEPREAIIREFSLPTFWVEQRKMVTKYDEIIKKLLTLPDATLADYLKKVGEEQGETYEPAREVHEWAAKQGLVNPVRDASGNILPDFIWQWWSFYFEPVDIMLFTYRINQNYPSWTPRAILLEIQKFSVEVKKVMP